MGIYADMKARWQKLAAEYGPIAVVVYFSIFFSVWGGFAAAIHMGFDIESAGGNAGTWTAAYIATKVTQPLRIAATLVITPIVARFLRRNKSAPAAEPTQAGPAPQPQSEPPPADASAP